MSGRSDRRTGADGGFSLVEMLVAIVLLSLLGVVFVTTVAGTNASAQNTKQEHDINEDGRLALNRMVRELRQATAVQAVRNADGAGYMASAVTAVTFAADFDGDAATNPEVFTYCYDPASPTVSATGKQLMLIAGPVTGASCNQAGAVPVLAANVSSFKIFYRSNAYLYDTNGDGVTSWTELDDAAPPVGDSDGDINTGELSSIDSVVVELNLLEGSHQQKYRTQVTLRNAS